MIPDGGFSCELQAALLAALDAARARCSWEAVTRWVLLPGTIGPCARALGSALLPLHANFALDCELFLKIATEQVREGCACAAAGRRPPRSGMAAARRAADAAAGRFTQIGIAKTHQSLGFTLNQQIAAIANCADMGTPLLADQPAGYRVAKRGVLPNRAKGVAGRCTLGQQQRRAGVRRPLDRPRKPPSGYFAQPLTEPM